MIMRRSADKVSMLVDGELTPAEIRRTVKDLQKQDALRKCWISYNLIGDALRNELPRVVKHDFAAGVMSRLASEPPLKSPSPWSSFLNLRAVPRYTVYATAFSVAVIAVLIGQWQPDTSTLRPNEVAVAPAAIPAAPPAAAQMAEAERPAPRASDAALYDYLISHTEYTQGATVRAGMSPYVNLAGYEPEQGIR